MATPAEQLKARVELAFPTVRLEDLTNMDQPGASGVNDAVLLQACENVIGLLDAHGWGEYSDADAQCVALSVDGVQIVLESRIRSEADAIRRARQQWGDEVKAAARTRRRDKVTATVPHVATTRSRFPPRSVRDHTPGMPGGGG